MSTVFTAPAEQPAGADFRQDRWRREARAALWRTGWRAASTLLAGCALIALALILIDRYPDSAPALFSVQLAAILAGPVMALVGLFWLWLLTRRRQAVQVRTWRPFPARAVTMHVGPFRLTTVGLTLPSGMVWVIFPEQIYRTRIRRLVERDGELLMLLPRPGHAFDRPMYAGAGGGPVFVDHSAMAAEAYWERRALRALRGNDDTKPYHV